MTHSWCSSEGGSQGNPSLGPTRFEQQKQRTTHTVRKRFIVWHTVRIDSSCAHVSTCGPHSKLCATIRGPPCKQGATSTTLHVFSFVAQQLSKIKLPSAFEKLTLCPPFRTHASSFSWLHPSINFTMFCREKLISLSTGTTTDSASFVRRVWSLWKSNVFVALRVRGVGGMVRDHVGRGYGKISQYFSSRPPCARVHSASSHLPLLNGLAPYFSFH